MTPEQRAYSRAAWAKITATEHGREWNRQKTKAWKLANPEKLKAQNARKRKTPAHLVRQRVLGALRRAAVSKTSSVSRLLGCTGKELVAHLESKFQPGMTWENRGFKGWHIDHIRPLSSFDLTDPAQLAAACHYTNLQPLWWRDNLSKGKKAL